MTLATASMQPSTNLVYWTPAQAYFAGAGGRSGMSEMSIVLSALIQQAGLAKTQLEGFGIFSRVTKTYIQFSNQAISPSFIIPAQVKTNDYMLAQVTTVSGTTITTPSGWSLIRSDTATGGTGPVTQSLYRRYAPGTVGQPSTDVGTTVTFVLSNNNQFASANLMVYGGVALSSEVNVQGVASSSVNGTTATAGALTTTVPNAYVIQLLGCDTASFPTWSTPAGYLKRADNSLFNNGGNITSAAFDIFQATAGSTGTPASTGSTTGSWVFQTLALVPTTSGANAFVPTATPVAGGTLTSGTACYYRVSALSMANTGTGETIPCAEVTATPSGANLSVQLSWSQVPQAVGYKIYGRSAGAELLIATIGSGSTLTYTDTGALTPSGALNTVDTSADSGQASFGAIQTATSLSPNTKYGYEIFQFTDTLQSTYPVFVRIDYGVGPAVADPQFWMNTGTATNGAGTLVSHPLYPNTTTVSQNLCTGASSVDWHSVNASPVYVDSDGGASLCFGGWVNPPGGGSSSSSGILGMVERTRDWDGTPNGEGVVCLWGGPFIGGANVFYQSVVIANAALFTGTAQIGTTPTNAILGSYAVTPAFVATVGQTVYVYPLLGPCTPKMNGPSKHLVLTNQGDIPSGITFPITIYGQSRTFQRSNSSGTSTATPAYCFRIA